MRTPTRLLLSTLGGLLAACGAGGSTADAGQPSSLLSITSLSASKTELKPGETTTVTAVLASRDAGASSGLLVRGSQTAGTFAPQANGQWTTSADFSGLVTSGDSEGPDKRVPVTVDATFFDAEGVPVSRSLDLQLTCGDSKQALCGGQCIDARTADNCGTCGHACREAPVATPGISINTGGNVACSTPSSATEPRCGGFAHVTDGGTSTSCTQVCAQLTAHGRTGKCVPRCLWGNSSFVQFNGGTTPGHAVYGPSFDELAYDALDCNWTPPPTAGGRDFRVLSCCCEF